MLIVTYKRATSGFFHQIVRPRSGAPTNPPAKRPEWAIGAIGAIGAASPRPRLAMTVPDGPAITVLEAKAGAATTAGAASPMVRVAEIK